MAHTAQLIFGYALFALMICIVFFLIIATLNQSDFRIFIKMLASSLFLGVGLFGYFQKSSLIASFVLIGLGFSFLGDLFLGLIKKDENRTYFLLGVGFFSLTHIFYGLAFYQVASFSIFHIIVLAFVYTILFFDFNSPYFDFKGNKVVVVIYATLISIVGGFALQALSSPEITIRFLSLGAISFFLSDFLLMHVYFYKNVTKGITPIYLLLYYVGQLLIAFSIFIQVI